MSLDFRTMSSKMFIELFPGVISYEKLPHRVVMNDRVVEIKHHGLTAPPPAKRPSHETSSPTQLHTLAPQAESRLALSHTHALETRVAIATWASMSAPLKNTGGCSLT